MPVSMSSPDGARPERNAALGEDELSILGARPLGPDDPGRVGRFELLGVLGTGGMGRVYLGHADERLVAVKVVRAEFADDPAFRTRFARELQAVSRIGGDFTASLADAQTEATRPWLATEYVPGLALDDAVTAGRPLPVEAVWRLAGGIAAALVAVHGAGLIHRDLKPGNVILALDGPKLIDFGIARSLDLSQLTVTGQQVGTPSYMAPEQASAGPVSTAADVFAYGCLLAFAATGAAPFGVGSQVEVAYRIVHAEPDLRALREADTELADLVARCLDKDPLARPDAAALVAAVGDERMSAEWPDQLRARIEPRARLANEASTLRRLSQREARAVPSGLTTWGGGGNGLPRKPAAALAARRRHWPVAIGAVAAAALIGAGAWVITQGGSIGHAANRPSLGAAAMGGSPHATSTAASDRAPHPSITPEASGNTSQSPGAASSSVNEPGPGSVVTVVTTTTAASTTAPTADAVTKPVPQTQSSPNVYYRLRDYHTGWCVVGATDTWVHQAACSSSPYDGWEYTASNNFQLTNHGNGMCLTYIPNDGSVTVVAHRCDSSDPNQRWNTAAETIYGDELKNLGTGKCLWSVGTVGSVALLPCDSSNHQDLWYGYGTA